MKSSKLFLLFFGITLFYQAPLMSRDLTDKKIPSKDYSVINDEKHSLVKFPPPNKSIVLFWASWCSPCKIEMARLSSSIKSGKIKPIQIFAINPFETLVDIKKFVSANNYPFTFLDAEDVGYDLGVTSTPTTLFLEGEKIVSYSSGLSFLGIWKAEKYLR